MPKCFAQISLGFQTSEDQVPPARQCQMCKETFSDYYQLDEHLKSHANSLEASLPVTSQSGADMRALEYQCTHCAKQSLKQSFSSLHALEQHVIHMHTGKGMYTYPPPSPRLVTSLSSTRYHPSTFIVSVDYYWHWFPNSPVIDIALWPSSPLI